MLGRPVDGAFFVDLGGEGVQTAIGLANSLDAAYAEKVCLALVQLVEAEEHGDARLALELQASTALAGIKVVQASGKFAKSLSAAPGDLLAKLVAAKSSAPIGLAHDIKAIESVCTGIQSIPVLTAFQAFQAEAFKNADHECYREAILEKFAGAKTEVKSLYRLGHRPCTGA